VYAAKPADVLPDGAALWVLAGQKKDEIRLIARFVSFLMRPEVQKEWVAATSYLPMTPAALAALRDSDIPPAMLDAAQKRLSVSRKDGTRLKHGPLRERLREFIGEEVSFVWNKGRAAKEALDVAVQRLHAALPQSVKPAKAAPAPKQ
jgi:sn-glycerol 3-phosphate transport system substrate-binding protein